MKLPITIYAVAIAYRSDEKIVLSVQTFSVSGRDPLTEEEVLNRGRGKDKKLSKWVEFACVSTCSIVEDI